jgi:hypothetical protein
MNHMEIDTIIMQYIYIYIYIYIWKLKVTSYIKSEYHVYWQKTDGEFHFRHSVMSRRQKRTYPV